MHFSKKNCISIRISLKFVPQGPIDNNPAMVQIMAWHRIGHKPLSEPILTHAALGRYELTWCYKTLLYTTELKTEHKQNNSTLCSKAADKFTFQIFTGSTYYMNTLTNRPSIPFPLHSKVNGWQESGTIHSLTFLSKTKSRTSQMFLYNSNWRTTFLEAINTKPFGPMFIRLWPTKIINKALKKLIISSFALN